MIKILTISVLIILLGACAGQNGKPKYNPKAIELNNRACEMMSRVQYDSALVLFDQAIDLDETYYLPHANKIGILTQRGEYDKALYESDMVVKKEPELAEGWAFGGMLHERQGNNETAMMYYRRSIELFDDRISNPDKADYIRANRMNRAFSLILLGQENEGRDEMRKLMEEDPENPDNMVIAELLKVNKYDYIREILNDDQPTVDNEPTETAQVTSPVATEQENTLIPEAQKISDAFDALKAKPDSKELQHEYVTVFPDDAVLFRKIYHPPTFDQLYSVSHFHILKLAELADAYPQEVGQKLVRLCVGLKKWEADAIGYVQHVTIGFTNSQYDSFMKTLKELNEQELDVLATFLADVENHSVYNDYTDLMNKFEADGEQGLYDLFEKAKQDRINRNDHAF